MNANRRSGVTSERDIDTLMRQSLVGTQLQSSQTVFEALDDLFRHSPEDSAPPQPNKRPASVTSRGEQAKRAKVNDLPSEEALDVFVANTETGKYEVVCSICNERLSFSRPTPYYLNRHKKIHKDRAFSCDQCGEKFTRYDLLDRHRDVHDKENYKSCSGCHRRFRDNSALHVHLEAESNRACHDAHYSPGQTGQSLQALPRDAPVVLKYSSNKREPQALPDESRFSTISTTSVHTIDNGSSDDSWSGTNSYPDLDENGSPSTLHTQPPMSPDNVPKPETLHDRTECSSDATASPQGASTVNTVSPCSSTLAALLRDGATETGDQRTEPQTTTLDWCFPDHGPLVMSDSPRLNRSLSFIQPLLFANDSDHSEAVSRSLETDMMKWQNLHARIFEKPLHELWSIELDLRSTAERMSTEDDEPPACDTCDLCGADHGTTARSIWEHAREHLLRRNVRDCKCYECGIEFTYRRNFVLHQNHGGYGGRLFEYATECARLGSAQNEEWLHTVLRQDFVELLRVCENAQLFDYLARLKERFQGIREPDTRSLQSLPVRLSGAFSILSAFSGRSWNTDPGVIRRSEADSLRGLFADLSLETPAHNFCIKVIGTDCAGRAELVTSFASGRLHRDQKFRINVDDELVSINIIQETPCREYYPAAFISKPTDPIVHGIAYIFSDESRFSLAEVEETADTYRGFPEMHALPSVWIANHSGAMERFPDIKANQDPSRQFAVCTAQWSSIEAALIALCRIMLKQHTKPRQPRSSKKKPRAGAAIKLQRGFNWRRNRLDDIDEDEQLTTPTVTSGLRLKQISAPLSSSPHLYNISDSAETFLA